MNSTAQWNLVIKKLILSGCTNKWLGIVCQFKTEPSFRHINLCCRDPPIEIAPLALIDFSPMTSVCTMVAHTGIIRFIISLSVNYFQMSHD